MNFIDKCFRIGPNAQYLTVLVLVFLAAFLLAGGVFFFLLRHRTLSRRMSRVLDPAAQGSPLKPRLFEEEETGVLGKVSKSLSSLHQPKEEAEVRKIRLRLLQAGLRSKQAYRSYLASKTFSPLFLAGVYLFKTSFYKVTTGAITVCLLLFMAGFYLPDLIVRHLTEKRRDGMRKALPEALDLMVVCVESGLGLDMTFKRVGDELKEIDKPLSDEFHLTNLEVKAGKPRADSLRNMALRTGIPEISNLMTMLVQTNRFGTSVADALRVHADGMRIKRRQVAEEKAAKASVKMTIPLILFILPALLIVLLGPAGITIMKTLLPALAGAH